MTGYDLFLSNGSSLTTINVKTIDDLDHTSLILIGQGIPDYGTPIAQDLVWMLENFAKTSAPVNPLVGQEWYDLSNDRMNVYTGTEWRPYLLGESSSSLFDMPVSSQNINFTVAASTAIFVGGSKTYLPEVLLLVPRGSYTATTSAIINLSVSSAGDVLSSTTITITSSTQFVKLPLNTQSKMVIGAQTVNLNVTTAATGGQLHYDAYLFGFTI